MNKVTWHWSGNEMILLLYHMQCPTIKHLPEAVLKELLGNVILAVGVLEGKIELVVSIQHLVTFGFCGAWTLHGATLTVDIHSYVFLQLLCVFLSRVAFATIRYEPRHL